MKTNVMIVGVGGQGTLLASRVLGNVVQKEGFDVKVSEVHGMSQRGGSVVTYVKYGDAVYSPIVGKGEADVILAFEELEAYRALPYLKKGGKLIVNTQRVNPMPVITGAMAYPENIVEELKKKCSVLAVDALALATKAGNQKAVNVVLLGCMASLTDIPFEKWMTAIRETVPPKFLAVNETAFTLGFGLNK